MALCTPPRRHSNDGEALDPSQEAFAHDSSDLHAKAALGASDMSTQRRLSHSDRLSSDAVMALELDIARLRRKMEDAFVQGDALTSDSVMEISRLLDVKINEYMRVVRK